MARSAGPGAVPPTALLALWLGCGLEPFEELWLHWGSGLLNRSAVLVRVFLGAPGVFFLGAPPPPVLPPCCLAKVLWV